MNKPIGLHISIDFDDLLSIQPSTTFEGKNTCNIRIINNEDTDDDDFYESASISIIELNQQQIQLVIDKLTEINEYLKENPLNNEYLNNRNKLRGANEQA